MNITIDKKADGSAILNVALAKADYAEKVDKELRKFGRDHQIPGFRKGHVPFGELKRRFGKQMTSDVINDTVYKGVIEYLRDNKIDILGEPMPVNVKEINLDNQEDYNFEYELALAPEIVAPVNKDVKLPFYTLEVTDEMINEQDEAFRRRFGAQQPGETFEPDAVVKGVFMELNEDGTVKEDEDAVQNINGIVGPIHFKNRDEAAKFEGKKVGDVVVFNPYNATGGDVVELSSMLGVDREKAANLKGDFNFTISEIIVLKPAEPGEELYTNAFGADKVHNEEEYRQAIKDMIAQQWLQNSRMLFTYTARKALLEKYGNFQLPERVLKTWLMRRNPEELNAENIDESFKAMENSLRWELLSGQIARDLNVQVTEEMALDFARMMARRQFAQYGMNNVPDETIDSYAKSILADKKYAPQLHDQVMESALFGAIDNAVTLETEEVNLERFKELFTQATGQE